MDPNATMRLINAALKRRRRTEAEESAEVLLHWIRGGGFLPDSRNIQRFLLLFYGSEIVGPQVRQLAAEFTDE